MALDNLTPADFFRWFSLGQAVRRGVRLEQVETVNAEEEEGESE